MSGRASRTHEPRRPTTRGRAAPRRGAGWLLAGVWLAGAGLIAGCGAGGDAGEEPAEGTLAPPANHAGTSAGLPPDAPPSPPRSDANTIRWTTASEISNYGYDIYRGDSPDGPFVKISEKPVAGAGTTDTPTRYEFVDDTIEPDKEYYYYVESISMDGSRQQFTPVRRAPPKAVAKADDAVETAESSEVGEDDGSG